MLRDKKPRPLLLIALLCAVGFIVFMVFPEPLAAEISMEPQWCRSFNTSTVDQTTQQALPQSSSQTKAPADLAEAEANNTPIGFRAGSRYGYFTSEGYFPVLATVQGGVAVADKAFVSWSSAPSSPRILQQPDSTSIAELPLGSVPFFSGESLFAVSADALSLQHYNQAGIRLWSYELSSHVSAFARGRTLTALGMLDGSIDVVDQAGQQQLRFYPGGSRLEVLLGLAISEEGDYIASLSGLDPQRLVVLGRGEGGYRVVSHRYLETAFRTPSSVAILPGAPYVVYRDAGGVGVSALDGSFTGLLPADVETFDLYPAHHHGVYYLVVHAGAKSELLSFRPPARLLGRSSLPDNTEFVRIIGDTMYIACPDGMAQIRIGEL
ncbi:MAG: hypothetical protein KKI09_13060 [Spirochaetes bacterium]|nr:hypothetical protein [Spirochaetota bacterium]